MNIAFVCDAYIPAPTGTAVSVASLKKSLELMGHNVYIFAPHNAGIKGKEGKTARLKASFSASDPFRPRVWPIGKPDRELIAKLKLDIVHSHYFYDNFPFAKWLANEASCPLIHTPYSILPEVAKLNKGFWSVFNPSKSLNSTIKYLSSCDHIVNLSKKSKQYFQNLNISTEMSVLPIGIFPKDFASYPPEAVKERFKIPTSRLTLLYVARIDEAANIVFLLRAFKKIWKALDEVHLLIIGGGKYFHEAQQLVDAQPFKEFITLVEFLPKSYVNKIFGACDIFVYPKKLDPEPLVVLESLASGTPVVAVKGFGVQDFVEDNADGFICREDVDEFAAKVVELGRREKMRTQFSLRARSNSSKYRSSNLTHDLVQLYDSIIKQNKHKLF